jgi:hypothetical protein
VRGARLDLEARAALVRILRESRAPQTIEISKAALHEASHAYIAELAGYTNIHAFIDSDGLSGRCYFTAQVPTYRVGEKVYRLTEASLRRRARVKMAGYIGEALAEGREVPSWGALLTAEGVDPVEAETFGTNPVQRYLAVMTNYYNGNVDAASSWLKRMFFESRWETIQDLRNGWPKVLRRARELDRRRKERR